MVTQTKQRRKGWVVDGCECGCAPLTRKSYTPHELLDEGLVVFPKSEPAEPPTKAEIEAQEVLDAVLAERGKIARELVANSAALTKRRRGPMVIYPPGYVDPAQGQEDDLERVRGVLMRAFEEFHEPEGRARVEVNRLAGLRGERARVARRRESEEAGAAVAAAREVSRRGSLDRVLGRR
ncbi:MAG: hypothetical protein IID31_14590 [Planctomycetes bacterium]|nr:hypothetical protein [Planctomycetota bacterium]